MMKKDIFGNHAHPFTVPEGYFDTFQERIMSRIQDEEIRSGEPYDRLDEVTPRQEYPDRLSLSSYIGTRRSLVRTAFIRTMVAAAACILFIFTGGLLYMKYADKQSVVAESVLDEDFYLWFYESEGAALLAESLDFDMPESFMYYETDYSEEDEAIIRFLERDNINVAAILYSIDNEAFYIP